LSKFKIPIGQRSEVEAAPADPKQRLEKMGIDKSGKRAAEKWDSEDTAEMKAAASGVAIFHGEPDVTSNEPDFEGHEPDDEEYIDPSFFSLDFKINGKAFRMAVDHILRIRHEELTDPSIETFNAQLEACSYYRFSFFAAAQQVGTRRKEVERAFRSWLAKRQDHWRDELSKARKKFRERHSLTSKDQPGITKDEILDAILMDKDEGPEYEKFQSEIEVLRQKEELLLELRDCLHDRGFHLGGIADRMSQHRSKPEF